MKYYFYNTIFILFVLIVINMFNIKLSICDLSGNKILSYSYSLNMDTSPSGDTSLTDWKYLIDKISITNNQNQDILSINITKTISVTHLLNDLVIHNKFIKFAVLKENTKYQYNTRSYSIIKLLIVSIGLSALMKFTLYILRIFFKALRLYLDNNATRLFVNNSVSYIYGWSYLCLTLITIYFLYITHHIDLNIFFNSDELFMIDIFNSLSNGANLKDWYLTTVPFYFPDYIIFAIAYFITPLAYWNALVFSLIQILIVVFLLYLLLKNFFDSAFAFTIAAVSVFVWCILSIQLVIFQPILLSVFHFGTVINTLIFSIVLVKSCDKTSIKENSIYSIILFLLAFIATISDLWFLIWCIIPLALSAAYTRHKIYCVMIVIGAFGALIGLLLSKYAVYHNVTLPVRIQVFYLGELSKKIFYLIKFIYNNWYITILVIFCGMCISVSYAKIKYTFYPSGLVIINYIRMLPVIFVPMILVHQLDYNLRYILPLAYFNICLVFTYLIVVYGRSVLNILLFFSLLFVFYLGIQDKYDTFYPDDIRCIDDSLTGSNIKNGIATYWIARRFNYLTRTDTHIIQFDGETGKHKLWQDYIYNDESSYDFLIYDKLKVDEANTINETIVRKKNGAPEKMVDCGVNSLMIYKPHQITIIK